MGTSQVSQRITSTFLGQVSPILWSISLGKHRFVACPPNYATTSASSWASMWVTPRIWTLRPWLWLITSTLGQHSFEYFVFTSSGSVDKHHPLVLSIPVAKDSIS